MSRIFRVYLDISAGQVSCRSYVTWHSRLRSTAVIVFTYAFFLGRSSLYVRYHVHFIMVLSKFFKDSFKLAILCFICETSTWLLDSCPLWDTWWRVFWGTCVLDRAFNRACGSENSTVLSCYATLIRSHENGETAVHGCNPALLRFCRCCVYLSHKSIAFPVFILSC